MGILGNPFQIKYEESPKIAANHCLSVVQRHPDRTEFDHVIHATVDLVPRLETEGELCGNDGKRVRKPENPAGHSGFTQQSSKLQTDLEHLSPAY
ncbi:hypothetical protein CEXT_363121 [Caerostris extrusa]|uniref:Uncharacterized protein n=1 Tax=Caerostris extrusa TaxID=172846 RepID=A0AAV4XT54_CAEEX|nr:hypothetical protein CEXT_363121 [Caerostris extrusa]